MSPLESNRVSSVLTLAATVTFLVATTAAYGQQSTPVSPDQASAANDTTAADNSDRATESDAHADQDSPALGVVVGSCPGQGVCVTDTIFGSPAERVGIRPGDYILAVNDQIVSTPLELKQKIEGLHSTDTIDLSVWRRGKTLTKQVPLASKADELPKNHRGWLGVMLADDPEQHPGVVIQHVQSNSPAARAGLKSGDRILRTNGNDVKSTEGFVDKVRDIEPGAELKLTIRRGDVDEEIAVIVGQVADAPMRWFRQSFRPPISDEGFEMPLMQPFPGAGVTDEVIDEMRQQIRALQGEVEQLKQPTPPPFDSELEGAKKPAKAIPNNEDASQIDNGRSQFVQTVVQHEGDGDSRDHDGRRNHAHHDQYNSPFPPNISNDWTHSRYRDQHYRHHHGSIDRYPYYYPYRYYYDRGLPYYYSGRYPYGYRGGIQIGPNFGVYW